jgi:hypothetical protein
MVPKLSVIMPVYNGAPFLDQAVASILGQTFPDFELVILDDGSEDATPSLLRECAAKDARISVVSGGRRGLVATLNDGLRRARADIVARMDADDVAYPERFARQYARISGAQDLWVLGTRWDVIDAKGRRRAGPASIPTTAYAVAATMPRSNAVHHPTVMMRRDRILELGGYRAAYLHAEDYDLWLRVIEAGGRVENLDWIGHSYRMGRDAPKSWQGAVGQISADLARATHMLRRMGREDPTQGMEHPPPVSTPSVLDRLLPDTIGFYRLLYEMEGPLTSPQAHRLMRLAWRMLPPRRQRREFQRRLLRVISLRSHWDGPMVLGLLRALAIHPGRFARLALAPQPQT